MDGFEDKEGARKRRISHPKTSAFKMQLSFKSSILIQHLSSSVVDRSKPVHGNQLLLCL